MKVNNAKKEFLSLFIFGFLLINTWLWIDLALAVEIFIQFYGSTFHYSGAPYLRKFDKPSDQIISNIFGCHMTVHTYVRPYVHLYVCPFM